MGCYLTNFGETAFNKVEILILNHGAKRQDIPQFLDPDIGKIAVCVVENGSFDAAVVVCSQKDFDYYNSPDPRHKTWLYMDLDAATKIEKSIPDWIKERKENA